tara:strand:- start:17550 stop:18125 length:576 start_codon:yes stop_codon:yes gene_type:complete
MGGGYYPAAAGVASSDSADSEGVAPVVGKLVSRHSFNRIKPVRGVIQRVTEASVTSEGEVVGSIGPGLMVLIAAGEGDTEKDADVLVGKIANLRIFSDAEGKMNLSVLDTGGEVLGVSQFTLFGDARKGRRPSFVGAMEPVRANELYERVIEGLRSAGVSKVATGRFRTEMKVALVNDGPVTLLIDTHKNF